MIKVESARLAAADGMPLSTRRVVGSGISAPLDTDPRSVAISWMVDHESAYRWLKMNIAGWIGGRHAKRSSLGGYRRRLDDL
jgi:hypothetical protein